MLGIIGKKLGMTQIFTDQGQIPVTVVEAQPNAVTKILEPSVMGYAAVELGHGRQRLARESKKKERSPRGRRANGAEVGHAKKAGLDYAPNVLRSFRLDDYPTGKGGKQTAPPELKIGDSVNVGIFAVGEEVKVTGTSKGRGFQGVVKRYGIGGGPNTHGNTKHRRPGSVGPGTDPSRVIKGKKMPGHHGSARHTVKNLRVEKVDLERHLIYLRGAVAGPTNGLVLVRKQA